MLRFLLLFAALFLDEAAPLFAWDAGGHEIVATIALDRLNPKARQAVIELARELPSTGRPYDAVTMACWMDDLRSNAALPGHGLFSTWHYIDLGIEPGDPAPSLTPGDDNEFHGNAVQALQRALVVLEGGIDPYLKTKAMACAMALHLAGDLHQPLHAATHYFETPGGWHHHDAGGNKEYVVNGPPEETRFNLHNFWDSAWRASFDPATGCVVLDPRYREAGFHDPTAIRPLAETLAAEPTPQADLEPHFSTWAEESNRIARDFVYRGITATESKKYCRLSSGYVAASNLLARQRPFLAACRLAVLLNETLGAEKPSPPPPAYPAGPAGAPYESGF
jgi:hypothetical protein